jgi:hypothetical protein
MIGLPKRGRKNCQQMKTPHPHDILAEMVNLGVWAERREWEGGDEHGSFPHQLTIQALIANPVGRNKLSAPFPPLSL